MSPRVSVVIPVYNRARLLAEAVESVLATRFADLEVVVVDDGSTDGSFEAAARLAAQDGRVRTLTHAGHVNRGEGASRNAGVRAARGRYVAFLDSDDLMLPHRFATAVPLLDTRPDVDGVYEWTRTRIEAGAEARAGTVRPIVSFECRDPADVLELVLRHGRHWSVDAILLRREVLMRVGGFSEDPRLPICADLVLWLKLAAAARLVLGSREPVAVYRLHAHNVSSTDSLRALVLPLRAHREALRWCRSAPVAPRQRALLREAVAQKLFYCCGELRSRGRPGLALRQILATLPALPSVTGRRLFWANLARAGLETLRARGTAA